MTSLTDVTALDTAHRAFRDRLVAGDLLVPMGIDGLYARSATFERIVEGIDTAIYATARAVHGDRPRVLRFPPVYPKTSFEKTDYLAAFPHLTGAISTFDGGQREHQALLADLGAGVPWDGHLSSGSTMLVSAACHPSYATLPAVLEDSGALMDIYGYCFRHEPAIDPARMQAFRMHEFVLVGTPAQARAHRDNWVQHGMAVLDGLGLTARAEVANDPFFGRTGRLLAANQRESTLKTELVVRLHDDLDDGTAVVSANCHEDHFGVNFGLTTADGGVAHSACVGFGMERLALAMLSTHGFDPAEWPADVRRILGW